MEDFRNDMGYKILLSEEQVNSLDMLLWHTNRVLGSINELLDIIMTNN